MGQDRSRKSSDDRVRPRSALFEGILGNVGAFLITFAVAYLIATVLSWAAGRFLSIGGGLGNVAVALVALGLTLAFYWYDRNNS